MYFIFIFILPYLCIFESTPFLLEEHTWGFVVFTFEPTVISRPPYILPSLSIAHAWSNHFSPLLLEGPKPPSLLLSTTARASLWSLFCSHSSVLFSGTTVICHSSVPSSSGFCHNQVPHVPLSPQLACIFFSPFSLHSVQVSWFLSAPKGLGVASSRDTLVIRIVWSGTHKLMSLLHLYVVFLPKLHLLGECFPTLLFSLPLNPVFL